MRRVGIIGLGWLGTRLAQRLQHEFKIFGTVRTPEKAEILRKQGYQVKIADFLNDGRYQDEQGQVSSSLHVIIICVPFSVRKASAPDASIKMKNLIHFIGDFKGQLFFTSSTGVYPKIVDVFTETTLPPKENLYERLILENYPLANILRLGGLMGDNRLLKNYTISDKEAPVNHTHYHDVCEVIQRMINQELTGKVYNVVAPMHPSKADIIDCQHGKRSSDSTPKKGRIISSQLIKKELPYTFEYPDPRLFHLTYGKRIR